MKVKVLIVALLGALFAAEAPALADVRIHVGGSLHVDGRIRIGRPRHRRVYRPVYVQPAPTVVYSAPPPCGCECETTCVQPAPDAHVVVQRPERRSWVGLGAYLSGTSLGEGEELAGEGAGLVGRLKFRSVELELSFAETEFPMIDRREGKIGGALIVPIWRGGLQPYLVVGAGVLGTEDTMTTGGTVETAWGYAEGGAGLNWNIGRRFAISGDVRWSTRREIEDEEYHTLEVREPLREKAVEGRVTGVLYF